MKAQRYYRIFLLITVSLVYGFLLLPLVIRDATLSRRDGLLFLSAWGAYMAFVGTGG